MDETIGKVMAKLNPDDLLMILSDHGFHSFRKEFNVNTWLVRNGYLAVKGQPDAATAFTDTKFLQDYDLEQVEGLQPRPREHLPQLEGPGRAGDRRAGRRRRARRRKSAPSCSR
jgi:predicted AlkP superfamily phosphohydrolase/phosphomutase